MTDLSQAPAEVPATHRALPLALFDQIRKFVGQMPHDQVRGLADALDSAVPIALTPPDAPAIEGQADGPPAQPRPARTKLPARK